MIGLNTLNPSLQLHWLLCLIVRGVRRESIHVIAPQLVLLFQSSLTLGVQIQILLQHPSDRNCCLLKLKQSPTMHAWNRGRIWTRTLITLVVVLNNVNVVVRAESIIPSCDTCPDETQIVCNTEGYAFPNHCFALCIGVPEDDIVNCSSSLLQEVEDAFKAANALCLNATCGATCSIRSNCGWDSSISQCIAGEVTDEEELSMGDCTELNMNDPCQVYSCGTNCSAAPNCGWDSLRMQCATGHTTSDAELFMGACDVSEDGFDMCEEFRPCLNEGNCTTTGDYRFTCDCKPGFSGMVCENDDREQVSSPSGTKRPLTDKGTEAAEDEDPFGGMFKGGSITSANAMVISIIVLLVSVLTSATVLYFRRRKLRRDAVTLDSYVEGYIGQAPRRKMNLHRGGSMASIDMEYDDNREVLGIGVDGTPHTHSKSIEMVQSRNNPVPVPRVSLDRNSPVPPPRRFAQSAEDQMMSCAQCDTKAPLANGSVDESDGKWYCNVCWRVLDETGA